MQFERTVFNAPARFDFKLQLSAQTERQIREMIAAAGLPSRPAPHDANALATGFVGRLEYFGCLLYDRKNADYIPFDLQATEIFLLSQSAPLDQIHEHFKDTFDRASLQQFADLCKSIGILDPWGRFAGQFVADARPGDPVLSAPTLVRLAVTNACNLRCGHCFTSAGSPYADELTTAEVLALIDELAELGCQKLSLGGGEPLVRRDLPAIVSHANTLGVGVLLATNAVAATPQTLASLAGLRFEEINVSMDAGTAARYDAVRGEAGAFEQALQGIGNLQGLGAPLSFRSLLQDGGVAELDGLIRLAERLGVQSIEFRSVLPVGRARQRPDLLLDTAQTNRWWNAIVAARVGTTVALRIPQQVPRDGRRVFDGFGCECGRLQCYVDARGAVTPSGLLKDALPTDSLRRSSLRQIWQHGEAFAQLRALKGNAMCRHCSHFAGCRGGCRARGWLLGGSFDRADPHCALVAEAIASGADERLASGLSVPE